MNRFQEIIASIFRLPKMTTLRNPADWLLDAFGIRKSASGIDVSHSKALGLSPYYCGLRMISETVGSLPLNVYKRRPIRGQDVWRDHPVHTMLHSEPNPEMTAMSLRQTLCAHAIGYGNAYAEIVRRGDGIPVQLWPIPPDRVKPKRDESGMLWYEVRLDTGGYAYVQAADMVHVPGLAFDGISGYSLIRVACESIGINLAQEEYSARFFSNGGHVSLVAETDNVLNDTSFERLKGELTKKIGGLTNAHRIALLEAGVKLKALNISNVDAQLLEGKRFSVEEWARWLNMPPHKLKEMTHATFSNIEHQNIEWVVDTITPWLVRFEQEFDRKLFRQKNLFYTKHVVDGLLRGDQKSRYEAYAVARNWGWMSANDVLELEDKNPLPGDIGDIYLSPGNMTRAEDAGQQINGNTEPEPPDNELSERIEQLAARLDITAGFLRIDNKIDDARNQPPHVTVNTPEQQAPVVNVQNDVHIPKQESPVVHVNNQVDIPEQAAPVVTVNNQVDVPEQQAPVINMHNDVNVPLQDPPVVNVNNQVDVPQMETPVVNVQNDIHVPENVPDVIVNNAENVPDVIINVPENVPVVEVTNNVETPQVTVENTVNVPDADRKVTFQRDANGNIVKADITDG